MTEPSAEEVGLAKQVPLMVQSSSKGPYYDFPCLCSINRTCEGHWQIARALRAHAEAAVQAERERCAEIAESHRAAEAPDEGLPAEIAAAIRAI